MPVAAMNRSEQWEEDLTVEQVEVVIAALRDKVTRLQKDIGALKRTETLASHRNTTATRIPTNLTETRNAEDESRLEKKKAERWAKDRREGSKGFRHEPSANFREASSSRELARIAASTSTTTQQQQQQRKHALFNAQRKNRSQPQEVDDRHNAIHLNASDSALLTAPPADQNQTASTRRVLRKRISRGIQYDTRDCRLYRVRMKCVLVKGAPTKHRLTHRQTPGGSKTRQEPEVRSIDSEQQDTSARGNMDEQTRHGIDGDQQRSDRRVAKSLATPHRRSKLPQPSSASFDNATAAPESSDAKRAAAPVGSDKGDGLPRQRNPRNKKKALSLREQELAPTTAQLDKPKDLINEKTKASNIDGKIKKFFKIGSKAQASKDSPTADSKIASSIKSSLVKQNNKPEPKQSITVIDKAPEGKNKNTIKRKFTAKKKSGSLKNEKKTEINTKSSDSIAPQYISIKNQFSECTKGLSELIVKLSTLVKKKNSKK